MCCVVSTLYIVFFVVIAGEKSGFVVMEGAVQERSADLVRGVDDEVFVMN